jgi:hypothetical protein
MYQCIFFTSYNLPQSFIPAGGQAAGKHGEAKAVEMVGQPQTKSRITAYRVQKIILKI